MYFLRALHLSDPEAITCDVARVCAAHTAFRCEDARGLERHTSRVDRRLLFLKQWRCRARICSPNLACILTGPPVEVTPKMRSISAQGKAS